MSRIMRSFHLSENNILLGLAVIVGLATAGALWLFRAGIEVFHFIFQEQIEENLFPFLGDWGIVLALTLAGLLVGWIKQRYVGPERYHGVAGVIEAVALAGGRLPYRRMPFKAVASAISLGAGSAVGPEDPSVQIGSNLGSYFGARLGLSEERMRLLVSAGAASAIAAAFNAPIAGVFFALEVVLYGELATAAVSVVILAAVISSSVTQGLNIGEAALGPFDFTLGSPLEVPFYIPLGLLLVPFSVAFVRLAYRTHDFLGHIKIPEMFKTAIAGALVGFVGIYLPEILGTGRELMSEVLHGDVEFTLTLLLAIAVFKILLTSLSLASGFVGGIFAPSLFIGTMIGELYGNIVTGTLGSIAGDPRSYAIAGMAGMMAGVVRAPITAIMLAFELTNDYRFILPIMLVSVVCIFVAERFQPYGVYELGLIRQGIRLQPGRDVDLMQGISVQEAMMTPPPTINHKASLLELRDRLREYHRHALCVINDKDKLIGIVTLSDLQRAYAENGGTSTLTVDDICVRDVVTANPQDALWLAIRNMSANGVGRLPVVDKRGRLVGMVNRQDIVDAYNTAFQRKFRDQQLAEQVRLNTLTGAHVYDMKIRARSALADSHIQDVSWPPETVVASIQRKGKLIVPHGHTQLKAGDHLTIVADPHVEIQLVNLFNSESHQAID